MRKVPEERCLACMKPLNAGTSMCFNCGTPVPCSPNPSDCLQPGYLLAGRFTIGQVIGRGGYGISYIAFDNRLQAVRCIKEYFPTNYGRNKDMSPIVAPGKEQDFERFSDRFLQEARIMSTLSADKVSNVVNVYDQLNLNGTTYILMEYLEGCTMDEWITRRKKALPWQEAVQAMVSVMQTLGEIHKHGYLHRDLSLSNIFRVQDGSVRVIDFGSAEPIDKAKNSPGEMWPSSKRYYSPEEQANNRVQGPWTDLYAAGACLFKMAAGGWPQNLQAGEAYPSLRALGIAVPDSLDKVISRATAPDPKKRYQSAGAMLEALNKISEDANKEPPIQISPSELDQKWLPLNVQPSKPVEPDRKWQQLNVQPSKPAEPDRKWQQLNVPPSKPAEPEQKWQQLNVQPSKPTEPKPVPPKQEKWEDVKPKKKKGLMFVIIGIAVVAITAVVIAVTSGAKDDGGGKNHTDEGTGIIVTPETWTNGIETDPGNPTPPAETKTELTENPIPDTPEPETETPVVIPDTPVPETHTPVMIPDTPVPETPTPVMIPDTPTPKT